MAQASKVATLSKEGITLDVLLTPKPVEVTMPLEHHFEQPIDDPTDVTKMERMSRNEQLKLLWEQKRQNGAESGILCCDRPWDLCDQKCVSL